MGVYFSADFVSRRVWRLYLAARRVECFAISVGEKLAVYVSALHGHYRVRLYRLARLHATLADARDVDHSEVAQQMRNPWAFAFMEVRIVASSFLLGVRIWNFLCKWCLAGKE